MTKPLVTVVIPTYNYANKVGRAISGVSTQTISNFECFIADDGSTDDTADVVYELIKHDSRFHYFKQNNGGVAVARNRGISLGTAPYVCCLDADDTIEPQFLEACIMVLSKNKEYSIAYTGLRFILPNGKEGVSDWPGEFNYELQLQRNNQIPTCCVFRRVMWERLGGYRKRYCPGGAGSEDAEFWLRAGAYGFNAIKATDAQLFVYSFLSGTVSGNKEYREINWLGNHPWVKDERHPFPSVAKPKKLSHPVHQYDKPVVSVIIPVGPSHRETVFDALDSLESQSFRDWEVIVVDDSGSDEPWEFDGFPDPWKAYPYARVYKTEGKKGAGYARNIGAKYAHGSLLLFLDADDSLVGEALEEMIITWGIEQKIVYSDYAGKAYLSQEEIDKNKSRVLYYDNNTQLAVMRHNSDDFDCERAIYEPSKSLYIWNLITSLVPRAWHEEIGGFDENMSAWEDWDYWIRMARAGKCFFHVRKPLVIYRFYTGTRREQGLQDFEYLIKYMQSKYEKSKIMPCNCGSKPYYQTQERPVDVQRREATEMFNKSDSDFVLTYYDHPNKGQHKVVGYVTRTNYGYRAGGDRFYVNRKDIAAQPNIFKIIEENVVVPEEAPIIPPPPPEIQPEVPINTSTTEESVNIMEIEGISLEKVPGITPNIRTQLNASGVHSLEELIEFGEEGLFSLKGIGKVRATTIYGFAKDYLEKHNA
jgi:glycosyltransferase involved in cell wall biosynthesis